MPNPSFVSQHTGADVEAAITKALQLDSFEYQSIVNIDSFAIHVLWKKQPTTTNTVYGLAVHPETGELLQVKSVNNTVTMLNYSAATTSGDTLILN
jgi:hypothetical protein